VTATGELKFRRGRDGNFQRGRWLRQAGAQKQAAGHSAEIRHGGAHLDIILHFDLWGIKKRHLSPALSPIPNGGEGENFVFVRLCAFLRHLFQEQ